MKVTITAELPDDFNKSETETWKASMTTMIGYYVKDILGNRNLKQREVAEKSVKFSELYQKTPSRD